MVILLSSKRFHFFVMKSLARRQLDWVQVAFQELTISKMFYNKRPGAI